MTYCMSDIHGELDKYQAMLKLINFSNKDTLIIVGDVIDRGPDGVDILLDIMSRKNILFVLGNHEELLLSTLGPNNSFGARQIWQSNGGGKTRKDLLYCRDTETRCRIIRFLLNTPDHLEMEVNGTLFHFVHGYPGGSRDIRLWERPKKKQPAPFADKIAVVGHTPTIDYAEDKTTPMVIWYGDGIIDIDCGCGHNDPRARLACLCLDTMQEFYI